MSKLNSFWLDWVEKLKKASKIYHSLAKGGQPKGENKDRIQKGKGNRN